MNGGEMPRFWRGAQTSPDFHPESWLAERERILGVVKSFIGHPTGLASSYRVREIEIQEHKPHPTGTLTKLRYETEPGEIVSAYLLVPHGVNKPHPTILCLHGTDVLAKDSLVYPSVDQPGIDLASQLTHQGFVTFSPDHLAAGERATAGWEPFDTAAFYDRHPHWSEVGKMIWDAQRAIDAMLLVPQIDAGRLGVTGHSLGGYGAFIAAAFEDRLRAVACSCGLTVWEENSQRLNWARQSGYRHLPALRQLFLANQVPFELYELASLVAPRPLLNISGMSDETYGANEYLPEVGRRLASLYRQINAPEAFANFLFGGGHDVPVYSQALIASWFSRWLTDPREQAEAGSRNLCASQAL
jgi:dienelactone hydrolase